MKKIVTIYRGRIWVDSEGVGQGSCFYFTLPEALIKDDQIAPGLNILPGNVPFAPDCFEGF